MFSCSLLASLNTRWSARHQKVCPNKIRPIATSAMTPRFKIAVHAAAKFRLILCLLRYSSKLLANATRGLHIRTMWLMVRVRCIETDRPRADACQVGYFFVPRRPAIRVPYTSPFQVLGDVKVTLIQ